MSNVVNEVLTHNLALMVEVLLTHNLASLTIEYAGSGDSGDTFDVTAFDSQGNPQSLPYAPVLGKCVRRVSSGAPNYTVTETAEDATEPRPFSSFVEDVHCAVLEREGKSGFEDNQGGGGTFTLDVSGACTLDHYDYIIERDESSSDLSEFMPPVPEPTPEHERKAVLLPAQSHSSPYCVEV